MGANGAGRTTAMKMLSYFQTYPMVKPQVARSMMWLTHAEQVKRNIGYMSHAFSRIMDLTIKENIVFFGGIYGLTSATIKEKSQALINELGLHDYGRFLVWYPCPWMENKQ